MRTWLPALALATVLAAPARADYGDNEPGLYLGTERHIKIGTGFGSVTGVDGGSIFGFIPTLEGRHKFSDKFGLQVIVPFAFTFISADSGESETRVDVGNPSAAFEVVLDDSGLGATIVRGGIAFPLLSAPGTFEDIVLMALNSDVAIGTSSMFNLWRHLPERLSLFGEIVGTVAADGLFMEFAGGLGIMIPTSDGGDVELVLQGSAKIGGGRKVIGYGGIGVVVIPTDLFNDDAQISILGGLIAREAGKVRLDVGLNLNLDDPYGFSLDEGILGVNVGVTIPW